MYFSVVKPTHSVWVGLIISALVTAIKFHSLLLQMNFIVWKIELKYL